MPGMNVYVHKNIPKGFVIKCVHAFTNCQDLLYYHRPKLRHRVSIFSQRIFAHQIRDQRIYLISQIFIAIAQTFRYIAQCFDRIL